MFDCQFVFTLYDNCIFSTVSEPNPIQLNMSSLPSVFQHRKSSIPADGFIFSTDEIHTLVQCLSARLKDIGQTPEAEALTEAAEYFAANTEVSETKIICIKSANDAVRYFNMDYIAFGGSVIIQLLKCYHHINNPLTACNIWIYNEEDVFDGLNKYGLSEEECI